MNLFKPAEIRAILVLSILVLIGSFLTMLKRQGKLSSLGLDLFLNDGRYNYSFTAENTDAGKSVSQLIPAVGDSANEVIDSSVVRILDINEAGYFDLQTLPGIGPVLAERIIAYRDSIGDFQTIDELVNVNGIGEKKLAGLESRITVR
jgi:competence ComEA-like helix-hairpin-helix protein